MMHWLLGFGVLVGSLTGAAKTMKSFHEMKIKNLEGQVYDFSQLKGKVALIVNTASECGYTGQYAGLQELYQQYKDQGLVVIGFPSNEFGQQEPGDREQIKQFCTRNYGVTFPMMDKSEVKGQETANPVYQYLKTQKPGEVEWNFEKFVVDQNGVVQGRFKSKVKPKDPQITALLDRLLGSAS